MGQCPDMARARTGSNSVTQVTAAQLWEQAAHNSVKERAAKALQTSSKE